MTILNLMKSFNISTKYCKNGNWEWCKYCLFYL